MSVTQQLETVGAQPAAAQPKAKKKSVLQFELTKKKVARKDLMNFSRQLAVFVRAGIPILDALDAITEEMGNKFFRAILEDIQVQLRSGSTFADATAAHAEAFPPYYLGILRSAELTGKLDSVLLQLSEYIERDLEARRKVTSALAYPTVIVATSLVVVVVLVAFVLPRFAAFFESLNAELPLPTRLLLGLADLVTGYWFVLVAAAIAVLLAALWTVRTATGRALRDRTLMRIPVVGDLIRHVMLERFCRILSAMMRAGVPLPDALRVTTGALANAVFRKGLDEAREAMMRGEGLARPLTDTGLFPASARQMFRVGESTGTLDDQLETAAEYFDRELDYKIKRMTALFEPAVLLFVGVIVGFVAIALVSAMYGIFGQSRTF